MILPTPSLAFLTFETGATRETGLSDNRHAAQSAIARIADPEIRAGVDAAINKNLMPAATEEYYPGFFNISADGGAYGGGATWPGLDSWQMAGAYLLLGRKRLVLDYFDYVHASQRKDGAIPFAIFTGDTRPGGFLSGLRVPDDTFTYKPPERKGLPASAEETHSWTGLFLHWQPKANPLGALGSVCYILTASEIFNSTHNKSWLGDRLPSVTAAAEYLLATKSPNGLIPGSGFYVETPPRYEWDGIAQCYVIHAFRELARLCGAVGDHAGRANWTLKADNLSKVFIDAFWRKDHFGEYVHPEHGLVDTHGLTDVNWAAIGFGIADRRRTKLLWPLMMRQKGFWLGGVPTQNVTKPFNNESWELNEDVPLSIDRTNDLAAMGRVWYLEAMACLRMNDKERLVESVRDVCRASEDGFWRERYHPQSDGTVTPAGAHKYCEYPAILIRVVLGNQGVFDR